MKKDYIRDYATEMFRTYAAAGMPTYEAERKRIYTEAIRKCSTRDAAVAHMQAEAAVEKAAPYLLDILAVESTMNLLERGNKRHIADAVKVVYFVAPTHPLEHRDIAARVLRYSMQCPAGTRTVYYWLKEARYLCAAFRGLHISDEDVKRYRIIL